MDQSQNSDKAAVLTRGPWAKKGPCVAETELARATRANGFGWLSIAKGELFLFISCILNDQHGHWTPGPRWWDLWTETRPSVSILTLPTSRCPVCWNGVWASIRMENRL